MQQRIHLAGSPASRRLLGLLGSDRGGNVAIEFGLLAVPFVLLVFAILESCISFAGQQVLANAADNVARQLRTGQVKESVITEPELRRRICEQISIVVAEGCPGLVVDLRQYGTFAEASKVRIKLTESREIDTRDFAVDPGKSQSINMLRVFYKWPVITDFMRKSMSNLKDNKTMHFATVTWKNEPFDD